MPALVDCLGRLAAAAASDSTASGRSSSSPPDPASRALLEILRSMGGDPDAGIGGGSAFLVLSQALGDVCMMVREMLFFFNYWSSVFVSVGTKHRHTLVAYDAVALHFLCTKTNTKLEIKS